MRREPEFSITVDGQKYWIEPRGKTGIYRICWTENHAKRTQSIGTSDPVAAKQGLKEFCDELERPTVSDSPRISELVDQYVRGCRGRVADMERIEFAAASINRHLGWVQLEDYQPRLARRYTKEREAGLGTIRRELGLLRAAFRWCSKEQLIGEAPFVPLPSKPAPKDRWLTREEVDQLFSGCVAHHLSVFIHVALQTAARTGAILELRWSKPKDDEFHPNVQFDANRIDFGQGVGNKGRAIVPMSATVREVLLEAREAAQTDYVIEHNGGPVASIKKAFRRTCERAELENVTPHTLRHTAATWMAQAGVPMKKISLMLGHRSERTTEETYAHWSPDWLADAVDALESNDSSQRFGTVNILQTRAQNGR